MGKQQTVDYFEKLHAVAMTNLNKVACELALAVAKSCDTSRVVAELSITYGISELQKKCADLFSKK
jgi:hypothetical protein